LEEAATEIGERLAEATTAGGEADETHDESDEDVPEDR
jgi:hypothetical protein